MDKKFKKLTKTRSLTIPQDMAAYLDLAPGTSVDLTAADGKLVVTKHIETCRFCSGTEQVKLFGDIFCCPLCSARLYKEVNT